MILKLYEGDLLRSDANIIAHQTNCKGIMGNGVAKQIRHKWSHINIKYREYCEPYNDSTHLLLGDCQLVSRTNEHDYKYVANLFGQDNISSSNRMTNYEAIFKALTKLKEEMEDSEFVKSVAFPYKMSSDLGGASWSIIFTMICEVFASTDLEVEIVKWNQNIQNNVLISTYDYGKNPKPYILYTDIIYPEGRRIV